MIDIQEFIYGCTPRALYKKRIVSAEGLDFNQFLMSFGGPFGAIMPDSGPSRPRHLPREGFAAPDFFRESSGAHLGPDL